MDGCGFRLIWTRGFLAPPRIAASPRTWGRKRWERPLLALLRRPRPPPVPVLVRISTGSTSRIDTAFAGSHSGATSLSSSTFTNRGAPDKAPARGDGPSRHLAPEPARAALDLGRRDRELGLDALPGRLRGPR